MASTTVRHYLKALWHRDSNSLGIIQSMLKEVWACLFPPVQQGK